MNGQPYSSFKEWEVDMDRVRSRPNDGHLMQQVRVRVKASSDSIQKQVYEYLQSMAMVHNPISIGQLLAMKSKKILMIRNSEDPWFYV